MWDAANANTNAPQKRVAQTMHALIGTPESIFFCQKFKTHCRMFK